MTTEHSNHHTWHDRVVWVVVGGVVGCREVVDMYFHTQLGTVREAAADTSGFLPGLALASLRFHHQSHSYTIINIVINIITKTNIVV